MRLSSIILLPLILFIAACQNNIVDSGLKVTKLAEGFEFTEGPACDARGNIFFTDQPNDRIMKYSIDGKISTFMQPCGRSNGLYFDKEGFLGPSPMKITSSGELTPIRILPLY